MLGCFTIHDLFFSRISAIFKQRAPPPDTHDMSLTTQPRPLFVTVLAGAMGTIGFGLSVFAVWVVWLVPTIKPVVPVQPLLQKPKKHRRRSSSPKVFGNGSHSSVKRRRSRQSLPAIISDVPVPVNVDLHVSFVDSHVVLPSPDPEPILIPSRDTSSSTLVSVPASSHKVSFSQDLVLDSDNSASQSNRRLRLPKIMGRRRAAMFEGDITQSDDPSPKSSLCSPVTRHNTCPNLPSENIDPRKFKPPSRSSSFPFRHRRMSSAPSTSPACAVGSIPQSDTSAVPTLTYFSLRPKACRSTSCSSTPSSPGRPRSAPRTQPYDYPHFATPPASRSELEADAVEKMKTLQEEPESTRIIRRRTNFFYDQETRRNVTEDGVLIEQ